MDHDYIDDIDDYVITIPFGKFRGQPITDIDSGYIGWLLDNAEHPWMNDAREALQQVIADRIETAHAAMPAYELNESQSQAVKLLADWLIDYEGPHAAKLEGGAGYGKSFATMDVVKAAQSVGYTVAACAPSYVATQVLAKQLEPFQVPTMTIARTVRLEKRYNGAEEVYVASEGTEPALRKVLGKGRLLIVDEYSMVNDTIGSWFLNAAETHGGKLLCVGDLHQLPPVKQDTPTVLSLIETSATLTEPMRYDTDSTLYAVEQHARHQPHGINWQAFEGSEVVLHTTRDSLLDQYVADYQSNPKDDCRMMLFRRVDVVNANRRIRNSLHGFDNSEVNPVLDGEKLMVMATNDVMPLDPQPKFDSDDGSIRFYSSTTFNVGSVVQGDGHYLANIGDFTFRLMFMVTENKADESKLGGREYNEQLHAIAEEATETGDWRQWHSFKQQFLGVGYAYAMTVHRCQGQTVDRAYFNPSALLASGGMGRALAYVAATRARKAVHVLVTP
ncbi:MAG: AAA family ATPase [Gammaproteobacteria bacterium]|nr:AAA family ATPase [Gammaproteobacteria bacterium]